MGTGTDPHTREQRFQGERQDEPTREPPDEDVVPPLVRKLERRRARYEQRPRWFKALWVLAGSLVLLAGIAMLITPGPAFVLIPIGLAMLAQQFDWAQGALERSLRYARRANERAKETSKTQRALVALLVGVAAAGFVTWAYLGEVPVLPV